MSITTSNEADRLLSLAFGEHWLTGGMLSRTREELNQVERLATDNVSQALHGLESLGRTLGMCDIPAPEARQLGWVIATLAEHASVALEMADTAREMHTPDFRAYYVEKMAASRG